MVKYIGGAGGRSRRKPRHNGTGRGKPGAARAKPANGGATESLRQRFERYSALARSALASGDAVEAEYYWQYAEHYLRLMNAAAASRP